MVETGLLLESSVLIGDGESAAKLMPLLEPVTPWGRKQLLGA